MSEELIKLLTDTAGYLRDTRNHAWPYVESGQQFQDMLNIADRIDSTLSALTAQQEPTEPVAKYGGRRKSPDGTNECWAFLLCKPEFDPPEGTKLYTAPTSGVRAGMLRAAEICKELEGKLSQGAGYAIRTAREAITHAADQVNAEGQESDKSVKAIRATVAGDTRSPATSAPPSDQPTDAVVVPVAELLVIEAAARAGFVNAQHNYKNLAGDFDSIRHRVSRLRAAQEAK